MTDQEKKEKRAKVLEKIRDMRARTEANGCTEAEAMEAALLVQRLMHAYNIELSDVDAVKDDRYGAGGRKVAKTSLHHDTQHTWVAIASLTNTKVWKKGPEVFFFGSEHDVNAAHYLVDLLRTTSESEFDKYLRGPERAPLHGIRLRKSWMMGFCQRVSERMKEMAKAEKEKYAPKPGECTSTALVVMRHQIVESKYNQYCLTNNMRLRHTSNGRYRKEDSAYGAGQAAGSRATFGGGASIGAPAKRLTA